MKKVIYIWQDLHLFKITKGTKSIYIKDESDLEKYIIKNSENGVKKLKKSDLKEFLDNEKQKLNLQRFKGLGEMNPEELVANNS